MRKNPSKSFAEKTPLPPILPPLQKKGITGCEKQIQNDSATTRQNNFIIRKKGTSFIESVTTRKPVEIYQIQQNATKDLNNFAKMQTNSFPYNANFKKEKVPFKENNINEDVSISYIDLENYVFDKNKEFKKRKMVQFEKINQNTNTSKSINNKRNGRKRKVQQCKTRKINWGSKNQAFDLAISAIKLNQDQNIQTPIDSLQELYVQML